MDAVGQFLEGDDDLKIIIRPTRWPSIDSCAQFDRIPYRKRSPPMRIGLNWTTLSCMSTAPGSLRQRRNCLNVPLGVN
ncbi:hypothetical protein OUZ56_004448 [Daphnia magna]|uniref:Uncharacterized protein n=1 Tax=Daphnia magna TaxID=35525 RepID=A0ABQ9YPZ2_9CRUS|nr:hypothetical protein OUZ56_004448 [Daphnia magna]